MRILFFLTFCLTSFCLSAQDNTVFKMSRQILYELEYQRDSNDLSSKKKEVMELLANDSLSLFQTLKKGQWDSVILKNKGNPSFSPYRTDFEDSEYPLDYKIFKFPNRTLVADSYNLFALDYQYYKTTDDFDWEIFPDTLLVAEKYIVQKACLMYGGRRWTAWFCPSIPLSDGPYIFSGLPGLIFNLHDESNSWIFTLLAMKPTDREVEVDMEKFQNLIPKSEFFRSRADFILNQSLIWKAQGMVTIPDPEQFQKAVAADKEKAKRVNYCIEIFTLSPLC